MTTISALSPELLAKYNNNLDSILYGEFENLDAELFKQLFAGMKELVGRYFRTKDREILFIETVFNYKLNFDNTKNNLDSFIESFEKILLCNDCNYYINCLYNADKIQLNIFQNKYLTYEILSKLFTDIDFKKIKAFNYSKIKSNIDLLGQIVPMSTESGHIKMEKLANYCFKFNYADMSKSEFIPLTRERLDTFETNYAAKYAPAQIIPMPAHITVDVITEYLINHELSNDEKQNIITVLLA